MRAGSRRRTEPMRRFPDHFSDRSDRYDEHRPTYPPEVAEALAGLVSRRDLAWDVGCGPGRLTTLLATHFVTVVGTDASRAQLEGAAGGAGRVAYACALAEEAPLADGTVDLVTAAQAAHWFDIDRFYGEVRRVARDGAAVTLVSYGPPEVGEEVDPVIDRYRYGVLADHWPAESRHVKERYATLPFPFEELSTPELVLEERWTAADFLGYAATWSGTRALERAGGAERFERFAEALTEAWGGPDRDRAVRWPLTVRAGRVGRPEPLSREGA